MLLADLHVHTKWSDGKLSVAEVVDLFGRTGHDVIAITDHVVNEDNLIGRVTHRFGLTVTKENFADYRADVEREARRAWDQYRMVVIAGCELTQNRITRGSSAHVLALGINDFVSADGTVEEMLVRANYARAVVVACHPHEQSEWFANTFYLWKKRDEVSRMIHLWELATRWDLFPPVARGPAPVHRHQRLPRPRASVRVEDAAPMREAHRRCHAHPAARERTGGDADGGGGGDSSAADAVPRHRMRSSI